MVQQLSARQPRYERVLLRSSSETLMGSEEFGIGPKVLDRMALKIGRLVGTGVQAGLVIGGGNLFRGAALSAADMDRMTGDHMGMLATAMNGLATCGVLERSDIPALVASTISMAGVTDRYNRRKVMRHPGDDEVVAFSASIGNPLFTTGSAACLRAIEIDADAVLKAIRVDDMYTADPFRDPNVKKFKRLTYGEVFDRKLGVADPTAICLCRDQSIPLRVFNMNKLGALLDIIVGGAGGTLIEEG